jgi:hypothetical protein
LRVVSRLWGRTESGFDKRSPATPTKPSPDAAEEDRVPDDPEGAGTTDRARGERQNGSRGRSGPSATRLRGSEGFRAKGARIQGAALPDENRASPGMKPAAATSRWKLPPCASWRPGMAKGPRQSFSGDQALAASHPPASTSTAPRSNLVA